MSFLDRPLQFTSLKPCSFHSNRRRSRDSDLITTRAASLPGNSPHSLLGLRTQEIAHRRSTLHISLARVTRKFDIVCWPILPAGVAWVGPQGWWAKAQKVRTLRRAVFAHRGQSARPRRHSSRAERFNGAAALRRGQRYILQSEKSRAINFNETAALHRGQPVKVVNVPPS
jgi:hypothetical protein